MIDPLQTLRADLLDERGFAVSAETRSQLTAGEVKAAVRAWEVDRLRITKLEQRVAEIESRQPEVDGAKILDNMMNAFRRWNRSTARSR